MQQRKKPILKTVQVKKAFPGVQALKGVDLELFNGEVLGLVGENGSGKSTLTKILTGAYSMDSGKIYLFEEPVTIKNPRHARSLGIHCIYQDLSLIDCLSVGENIFLSELRKYKKAPYVIDWNKIYEKASCLLQKFDLDIDPRTPLEMLNIAQKHLIEIIKAISSDCKVLLMDEPSAVLGAQEIEVLFDLIRNIARQGTSIMYISHRLDEVFEITERVTVMRDGLVIDTRETSNLSNDELISMMTGRSIKEMYPRRDMGCTSSKIFISVKNAQNPKVHPEPIDVELREGEVLGVLGLTGSGKSELLQLLFDKKANTTVSITMHKKPVRIDSPYDAIRHGIAYLSEDRRKNAIFLDLATPENISAAALEKFRGWLAKMLYKKERQVAEHYVRELNIKVSNPRTLLGNLSGGNQQKVALAKWLVADANIFILDEPTKGIDVGAKVQIYKIIDGLRKRGNTIVIISSELPEILGLSDRILVMYRGRKVAIFQNDSSLDRDLLLKAFINGERFLEGLTEYEKKTVSN